MDYYNNKNYYDILGVKEDASLENIERAKNRLKFGDSDDRAPFSMWAKIDEAYSVLSDSEKRKEYDEKLKGLTDIYSSSDFSGATTSSEEPTEVVEEPQVQDEEPTEVVEEPQVQDEESTEVMEEPQVQDEESTEVMEEPQVQDEEPFESIEEPTNVTDKPQKEDGYDLKYVSPYSSGLNNHPVLDAVGKGAKKVGGALLYPVKKLVKLLKTPAIYAGGALVGYAVIGPVGVIGGLVATKLIRKLSKGKLKLVRDKKPKKISKVAIMESQAREEYLANLDREINDLLSKPHNNYKLEILRVKYENQIKLIQQILEINLRKKLKKGEFVFHKLKIMDIKMQLDSATKNLEKINEQIAEYGKEQGLSKTNKELIGVNQRLEEKKDMKPLAVQKLKVYRSELLKKRDKKATAIKASVLRKGKFYDSIVRAKDFIVSRKYLFTPSEQIDEEIEAVRTR